MKREKIYSILDEVYFSENPHESEVMKHMSQLLKKCNLFVDVGASLGQFTKLANDNMENGLILSIEADPIRFDRLSKNCVIWEKKGTNKIIPMFGAITENKEIVKFQTTNSNISGGLYRHQIKESDISPDVIWDEIEIQGITLDQLCEERIPNLIKMDIEGAELQALKGGKQLLRNKNTVIIAELHTFMEVGGRRNITECKKFMKSNGYWNAPFYGKTIFFPSLLRYLPLLIKYYFIRIFKYVL